MYRKILAMHTRSLAREASLGIRELKGFIEDHENSWLFLVLHDLIKCQHPTITRQIVHCITDRNIMVRYRQKLIELLSHSRLSFVVTSLVSLLPPAIELAVTTEQTTNLKLNILSTLSIIARNPDTSEADRRIAQRAIERVRKNGKNPLQDRRISNKALQLVLSEIQQHIPKEAPVQPPRKPAHVISLSEFRRATRSTE